MCQNWKCARTLNVSWALGPTVFRATVFVHRDAFSIPFWHLVSFMSKTLCVIRYGYGLLILYDWMTVGHNLVFTSLLYSCSSQLLLLGRATFKMFDSTEPSSSIYSIDIVFTQFLQNKYSVHSYLDILPLSLVLLMKEWLFLSFPFRFDHEYAITLHNATVCWSLYITLLETQLLLILSKYTWLSIVVNGGAL